MTEYNYPEPIIKNPDGTVTVDMRKIDPTFDVVVHIPEVKQRRGNGVSDAKHLKKLRSEHYPIIQSMIKRSGMPAPQKMDGILSRMVFDSINGTIPECSLINPKNFDYNGWRRYVSELLYRRIIYKDKGYHIDTETATKALETDRF